LMLKKSAGFLTQLEKFGL